MNWTEVNIYTETEGVDILCASLMDIGIKGFVIKDSMILKSFWKIRMVNGIILTMIL